jgi:hypothetical protein
MEFASIAQPTSVYGLMTPAEAGLLEESGYVSFNLSPILVLRHCQRQGWRRTISFELCAAE